MQHHIVDSNNTGVAYFCGRPCLPFKASYQFIPFSIPKLRW